MTWLKRNRLEELAVKIDDIAYRQSQILDMLTKMGAQLGFKFKRVKNPRRVEVGKRSWAARKAREAEAAQANGLLGLADGPQGTSRES